MSKKLIVGVIFVFILIFFVIYYLFNQNKQNISSTQNIQDYSSIKNGKFKKVTIKKQDETGCMEVNFEGIVRIYENCGDEVSEAKRLVDTRFINRLFQIIGDGDLSKLPTSGSGPYIDLEIVTEDGTETIRIYQGGNDGDGDLVDDIIEVIEIIKDQTVTPTPMPNISLTPTDVQIPSTTPLATVTFYPTPSVTNSSSEGQPFSCYYQDAQGNKKPYNISNILCTSEPTPGQNP